VRALAILLLALAAGCSTYKTPASLDAIEQPLARFDREDETLRASVVPIADKKAAKAFLGVDPAKLGAVPVMIEVENRSGAPLKLVPGSMRLHGASGAQLPAIDIDDAYIRGQKSGMGDAIAAGIISGLLLGPSGVALGTLVGASHADSVDRTASADYVAKRFHPWLLPAGGKASGVVFFEGAPQAFTSLRFQVREIESNSSHEWSIALEKAAP